MRAVLIALSLLLSGPWTGCIADELLFPNSDFETGTLQNWTAEGDAFRNQPTRGDNPAARNRESAQPQGDWWLGGYENYTGADGQPGRTQGDRPTGTLTSTNFVIRHPFITFRIGGGHQPETLGVRLRIDGNVVASESGVDSETMQCFAFDVRDHLGKTARLEIHDDATGGWGHINVDDFRGSETRPPETTGEFQFTDNISASAYPDTGYDQLLRPQFHFSSRRNWINDPNGMVFDGERFHLFFQHNPLGTKWGNMTWGHATSDNMLHWSQHDHALLPYRVDRRSGTIFSGTAVIDHNDSLGVQQGDTPTMCLFYTFANKPKFYQAMAYSTDGGQTFQYHNDGRAVVENQGFDNGERDPKVFWHDPTQRWVMALWVERKPGRVRFFTSKNLVDWTFASDLMRDWAYECMDIVFLPVDGDPGRTKAVLYDASFDYEVGTFDGTTFHSETPVRKMGRGNFYAAQTFNQMPDGRAVQMGWMKSAVDTADVFDVPHNGQMSFPCDLTLRTIDDAPTLYVWPIPEADALVKKREKLSSVRLPIDEATRIADEIDLTDIELTLDVGSAKQIELHLGHVQLTLDVSAGVMQHNGLVAGDASKPVTTMAELSPRDRKLHLRFLIDRLTVEAYAFEGEKFAAHYYDPRATSPASTITAIGGEATIDSIEIRHLQSIW